MRSPLLSLGATSVLTMVGCGLPSQPDGPDAETTSTSATALVVVERTAGPGDAIHGDALVARFVRVRQGAVDDPALRLAGGALDVPTLGACVSAAEPQVATAGRSVELVDVGNVSFEGAQGKTLLFPRAMPDPSGAVSGLFYSARAMEAFTPGARVQLRVTGSADLPDGFLVNVTSPRDVGDVHAFSSQFGLELAWDADSADTRDLVYVDVTAAQTLVARCATTDLGRFVVPQATIAGIDEGEVAVHRVHREPFRARGIDSGEVRFDLARVVAFRR
jgi:hypothetical protein